MPTHGDVYVIGGLNIVLPDIDGCARTAANREVTTDADAHVVLCGLIDVDADRTEPNGVGGWTSGNRQPRICSVKGVHNIWSQSVCLPQDGLNAVIDIAA